MNLYIDAQNGLLIPARFIASPNANTRPENSKINMLVIHGISLPEGKFGGEDVIHLFLNQLEYMKDLKVSSHLFIRRSGEIIQFVPFHLRAWHAGVSFFDGEKNCNDFSIGIELEGTDTLPYEEVQYQLLKDIIILLKKTYPDITDKRIVGHSDIAPGRKTDPGFAFEWSRIQL
jgi:AmpD protein